MALIGAALLASAAAGVAMAQEIGAAPSQGAWLSRPGSGWATAVGGNARIWSGDVACMWRSGYDDGVSSVSGYDVPLSDGDERITQIALKVRDGIGSNVSVTSREEVVHAPRTRVA